MTSNDVQAGPSLTIGVLAETSPGERRVALDPEVAASLTGKGFAVAVEAGAGAGAAFPDSQYSDAGARIAPREDVVTADIVATVRRPPDETIAALRSGQLLIGLLEPLQHLEMVRELCDRGVTAAAFELVPRLLSRAQSMDALSSQAAAAGYRAAIVAAEGFGGFFPMMITAAGTARPARVLVIGAGVAGLQALSTARRLGAVVTGYDVRPESRQEVESVGATFATSSVAEGTGSGGYARAMTVDELVAQQEELSALIGMSDVVITTAKVPGAKPPLLVPPTAIARLRPGSVCVDLAAGPAGGNVSGSVDGGRTITSSGVHVIGDGNLAASLPTSASSMYAKNVQALIATLTEAGRIAIDPSDELHRTVVVCHAGAIVNEQLAGLLHPSSPTRESDESPKKVDVNS
ncbi:NAD(P) transhydrogenase subunit alpha [Leifsonia sp. LS1]|uniref:NAD(P) transhydrogenase subunit alpha n=1 Tax=Leifsonia sp. LS1 TaxID=2828483 RepID=UPI001CFF2274|nr:NAD(P) transhydrogenase subunit alpha [Leifsonia sp. LS1]GIT78401.1 NAD(P) transhydrogenase subunit alpha [Leifsonia sp. LS1]